MQHKRKEKPVKSEIVQTGTAIVPAQQALPAVQTNDPESLIALAIREKLPVENLERLMKMRSEFRAEQARELYFKALAQFQRECPPVPKSKKVLNKDKTVRYKYAPLDVIVDTAKDALANNGFSYRFETDPQPNDLIITCILTHEAGHFELTKMKVPIDTESYMNSPQKQGSAITFGKRYTFVNATGILTADEDDDAQGTDNDEQPITHKPQGQGQAPGKFQAQPASQPRGPLGDNPPASSAQAAGTPAVTDKDRQTNGTNLDRVLKMVNLSKQQMDSLIKDANLHTIPDYEKILVKVIQWFVTKNVTEKRFDDEKFINSIMIELDAYSIIDMNLNTAILALDSMISYFKNKKEAPNAGK